MAYDIETLISDRTAFNAFVYTPLHDAMKELEARQSDPKLLEYLEKTLPAGVPEILKGKKHTFLSRDVATTNYEARRFVYINDAMDDFTPVFWEYAQDKFTPEVNEAKHALGKMTFYAGRAKNGTEIIQKVNIIDFQVSTGKKISEVMTKWGQPLIDFHHELFSFTGQRISDIIFYDASEWYAKSGLTVDKYYKHLFKLFLVHGINFENFLLENAHEKQFICDVFLPAFISILEDTGKKPLIVALEPTDMEGNSFWHYYPIESMDYVKKKQSSDIIKST